ncbi:hypothetical protein KKG19_03315 [Patescibacteria group bacterium]|nr:hypothetical protein [Patescibacteria group bacterium]
MTRKQKIGIGMALIAVIIMLIWLWLLRGPAPAVPPAVIAPAIEEETQAPTPVPTQEMAAEQAKRDESAGLQSLAKTFTERYGSFSTEANFANLSDVMIMMTPSFSAQTQADIEAASLGENFYGVTTKVVSVSVDQLDEEAGLAKLTINTQRQEAVDSPQNISVKYQDLVLNFEMISGTWKVSSAVWQ